MIHVFRRNEIHFVCQSKSNLNSADIEKLKWLFGGAEKMEEANVEGRFVGPRASMITPWSTNAVEITQNMALNGLVRIEKFERSELNDFDPMLFQVYRGIGQKIFDIDISPEPILQINDIAAYNNKEGLALNEEEVEYLNGLSARLGRNLTDSEVFGFSQVNSEHCRHKIFNGSFIIDGEEKERSLFKMIKETSLENPNTIVSAYKDNVAFIKGPKIKIFAPEKVDSPSSYSERDAKSVISLKAETHNFPTTVEPFNGAATGSGGEIRDRLAGGQGAVPLAGTAVYMTSYSRLTEDRPWEGAYEPRKWLYQAPVDILIKASNGASDFGNKFGQPLISGSVYTFEHFDENHHIGFDKVIMLAGGIGYGLQEQAIKKVPQKGDKIVILGGDNYRIGMGGAAVSSADTGEFGSGIELNAIQRSNPEMQKRVSNTIRALVETQDNPIVSIHDHGAGGHLNCLSELVEDTGGRIDISKLPIGDPTLSLKEIIGNESQERMGLVIAEKDISLLEAVAYRERAPMYIVGEVTDDHRFTFYKDAQRPIDLQLADMFGSSPKTVMEDQSKAINYLPVEYDTGDLETYLDQVLQLEAVACKDWLTNKVDRCVGGLVAKQQTCGELQLPLNNVGVMAIDYTTNRGIATSIGHASGASLIDSAKGARLSIIEALTNIIWAPLDDGLKSVSLSANWMWPCRNQGEDARLYNAVEAVSAFAIGLGINVPTGKDSLSMAQKYQDKTVLSPGTVIISATGHCSDITKVVEPVAKAHSAKIYHIPLSEEAKELGGSCLAQIVNKVGIKCPDASRAPYIIQVFDAVQELIREDKIIAGHDVSSGGLITSLLEMCFPSSAIGLDVNLTDYNGDDIQILFSESPGILLQMEDEDARRLKENGISLHPIASVNRGKTLRIQANGSYEFNTEDKRDLWFKTSYLLDQRQTAGNKAAERFDNYKKQPLNYKFPSTFDGLLPNINTNPKPLAAIIREKGSNSEREMANALYRAGFEVRDVHMTDLITGREDLSDIQFLGAVGGFSNSDVLGSAKGWTGSFLYNEKANNALRQFFAKENTLSIGICNGCQLFLELELLNPEHRLKPKMVHNESMKHECGFTSITVQENESIMMGNLAGSTLGVWISHGEGKFHMPSPEHSYHIVGKYGHGGYPANPNGSDYNTAVLASADGRHLVTMPHIERSFYPWNWPFYPEDRSGDLVSPWSIAFMNAYNWCKSS